MIVKRGPILPKLLVFARRAGGGGEEPDALGGLGRGRDNIPNTNRVGPTGNDVNFVAYCPFLLGPLARHNLE